MNFDFTPDNALELVKLLNPFIAVLATYLVTKTEWPSSVKAGLAFLVSAIIAGLTAFGEGALVENFWNNMFSIFTAAQAIYWAVFKGIGLERFVKPAESVAGEAANQVKAQVAALPESQIKAAADPSRAEDVVVQTKVVV